MDEFDVIVIGGGPAGENAAQYAVQGTDRTAAIVEAELLGGECSYWACMPSKALLRPLDVRRTAQHLEGITDPDVDVAGLLARRDVWVSRYSDAGQVTWAEGAGLTVVRGRGRLAGKREVEVASGAETRLLRAREAVVIATGSVAVVPDELAAVAPWTSRDATGVKEVPASLAIVGGGVVASEAAQWMADLGCRVTVLVRGDRLLGRTEPFAGELVAEGLRSAGVDVRLGVSVTSATRDQVAGAPEIGRPHGGPVTLTLSDGSTLEVAEVLAATGRRPATDGLGLDDDGDPLPDWLHTVGDASGVAPLTHWGKYQARQVGALIQARARGESPPSPPETVPVPQVVFTDPQVAAVGLRADESGPGARVLDADLSGVAGASLLRDDLSGKVRLVVEKGVLVGATFVGPEVAELVHAATVAIVGRVPVEVLRHAVPSYPTASEIWLRLLEQ